MNTRSIRFRFTVWYAGLLAALLSLFGVFIYFTLDQFLERSLGETLAKEAQTIGETLISDIRQTGPAYVTAEIEEHFAPSITGRFLRITRRADGTVIYHSSAPENGAFDPSKVGPDGGYLLMRNALRPMDQIATTAERITSRNLNERLPVAPTGDEVERLSVSLNRMMERLEDAFHHISRFSADASHEIRTPLAIIRGELENAFQLPGLTSELRDTIGSALEEAERLSRIVEQLLEMSRLEAGETLVDRTRFDFNEMTRSTVDQMRLLAEEKSVQLRFEGIKAIDFEGDPLRLKQVVVNLVDNAIKYTPAGGSVCVSTLPMDGKVVLEVTDTGIGVPQEALSQIFDRFFRVDKARSRQLGSTGLGLAIVKSICAAYNGTITVKSAEGKGAVFRVEIPLEMKS